MAKPKNKNRSKNIIIYVLILIIIVLLAFILLRDSFSNYHSWRGKQNYFKNNPSPKIESWMTPNMVLRHFNISDSVIFSQLNINKTNADLRTPIADLCKKQNINCSLFIDQLNNMVR